MPNWCNNTVEIYHDDPAMIERVRTAFNGEGLLQEFIPVPQALRNRNELCQQAAIIERSSHSLNHCWVFVLNLDCVVAPIRHISMVLPIRMI